MKREKGVLRGMHHCFRFQDDQKGTEEEPFEFTLPSLLKRPVLFSSQKCLILFLLGTVSQMFQPLPLFPCE